MPLDSTLVIVTHAQPPFTRLFHSSVPFWKQFCLPETPKFIQKMKQMPHQLGDSPLTSLGRRWPLQLGRSRPVPPQTTPPIAFAHQLLCVNYHPLGPRQVGEDRQSSERGSFVWCCDSGNRSLLLPDGQASFSQSGNNNLNLQHQS